LPVCLVYAAWVVVAHIHLAATVTSHLEEAVLPFVVEYSALYHKMIWSHT
jgi:hypothetical protein